MNNLPNELIAIPRYPGYFWHPERDLLYSVKVTGELRALTAREAWRESPAGFTVSKKGRTRRLSFDYLRNLKPHNYEVPYA